MDLEKFWKTIPDKEALDSLSRSQSMGIFRLLMLGAFADDEVTSEERLTLAQAVTRLPFFEPDQWKRFETTEGIAILANLHERSKQPDQFEAIIAEIRDALEDEPGRVLGLRLLARFMQPDGYDTDEHAFCTMVGQAFGLDAEEINVIIEDVVDAAEAP